jgi:hypothetical protein
MKASINRSLILILIPMFALSCASYKATSLPKLNPEFAPKAAKQGEVVCAVKVFTKDDCRKYYDKDIIELGYQPIQIAIQNQSKSYYLFSKDGINLPTVPPEEVAKKAHRSTVGRAVGYGVAGLFIWPLLIPAVVDGVGSSKANTQMDIDFAAKGLQETVIQPFSTANGVIFVPTSELQPNLIINIVDRETREKLSFTFSNIK